MGVMNRPPEARDSQATTALEQRVGRLEDQLDALIEAIEVLARGLEDGPMTEPAGAGAEKAARQTHELLLLAKASRQGSGAQA